MIFFHCESSYPCEGENCYFKQLARKTQIVEQQQKTLDELIGCVSLWEEFTEEESKLAKDSSIADLIMLLRKKTQECEELKEELTTYKKMLDDPEFKIALTDVRTGEREVWRKLGSKADRYRKALEEIEEVADDYNRVGKTSQYYRDGFEQILNIINKAKGGNE